MASSQIHIGASVPGIKKSPEKTVISQNKKGLFGLINKGLASLSPIKIADKVTFFRLLATMINAGVSIVRALHILEKEIQNPHFKNIIADIAHRIETGSKFSTSLEHYPQVFTQAQVGMVEAGEVSGRLNEVALQIAAEMEKASSLNSKIKGAMFYPVVVLVILAAAGFAVMTMVIPKVKEMFESLGGELPAMTQALIKASDFLTSSTLGLANTLWAAIILAGAISVFLGWKRSYSGKQLWDRAVLHFPIFGKLSKNVALARFCRSLSTLTGSGISIIKALQITATSVDNRVYENRILEIADDVKQGIPMGENMKDSEALFPSMLVGMISVAEQTAQIDSMTDKLAGFYEERVENTVKNLSALMEPLIIVVLGGVVGFLVLAVMLPILQSSDLATLGA